MKKVLGYRVVVGSVTHHYVYYCTDCGKPDRQDCEDIVDRADLSGDGQQVVCDECCDYVDKELR